MSKTLVIYCYFRETEATNYFFDHGIVHRQITDPRFPVADYSIVENSPSVDYMFVVNNEDVNNPTPLPEKILNYENVSVLNRGNDGRDWGAYSDALQRKKDDGSIDNYDYFIFLNETVIGPFLPVWGDKKNWTTAFTDLINERDKLVGCTINCCYMTPTTYMPHVQTFLFATDHTGIQIGFDEGVFSSAVSDLKFDVIYEKEIGFSRAILSNGYNIACLMSCYKGIDFRKGEPEIKGSDPWIQEGYFSCNIHPYETIFFKNNRRLQTKLIENLKSWSNL